MKAKQGYLQGMNQDAAYNKRNANQYYSAHNFRVVTEEGLSTGSLEVESGHTVAFTLPSLAEMTANGEVIPAQANLKIVGWCTIVDNIILFTTNVSEESPTTGYGQIWSFKFDETTETIIGLVAGSLVAATHLKYNNLVNFSTFNKIKAVGRYETTTKQRVYWTDNYNAVRTLNLANPTVLDTPLQNIDLQPGANLTMPVILNSSSGNLPTGIKIQFAYRLISSDGAVTLYSPVSSAYPLPNSDPYGTVYGTFEGDGDTATFTKAVTYTIKGIDLDFDVVEHVAIVYTALNVYAVYKFDETAVPLTSTDITVTCTDLTSASLVTNTEFAMLSSGFEKAKDIEVKDSRLIAANTTTTNFDIDFDARAYRFDSARQALIVDGILGNITIDGTAGTIDYSIAEDHDAICPYNIEQNYVSLASTLYKYKADGVTLGGEGLNLSYTFVEHEMASVDSAATTTAPPHLASSKWSSAATPDTIGMLDANSNLVEIEKAGSFKQFAGSYNSSYFTGYSRGEIYRFGIVFYNAKGSTSFVKWIGDIRFPEPEDGYYIGSSTGSTTDPSLANPLLRSLGIKFNVYHTALAGLGITGYSIVRVKREEKDKTRLGSGLLQLWDAQDTANNDWLGFSGGGAVVGSTKGSAFELYGLAVGPSWHLGDKPGYNHPQLTASTAKRLTYLIGPFSKIRDKTFVSKTQDYIKTTGYYRATAHQYGDLNGASTLHMGLDYKCRDFLPYASATENNAERFEIYKGRRLETGEVILPQTDIIDGGYSGATFYMRNSLYCEDGGGSQDIPLGIGNPKLSLTLNHTPTVAHATGDPASNMQWHTGGDFTTVNYAGSGQVWVEDFWYKEVLYCRYLSNQYGGSSYEDRSVNQYISTGHFQPLNSSIPSPINTEVWGGDTFVNYYDDEYTEQYLIDSVAYLDPYTETPETLSISIAVCMPVESTVNTDMITGKRWFADRLITDADYNIYAHNEYTYNSVWSQELTSTEKYFAKDFLSDFTEEHPHQLWASDNKIDGELIDNWRSFPIANATEVNGVFGPVNALKNFRDKLFFFQDSGIGIAAIDDRTVINDLSGQELVLGSGGVFPDYQYISTISGTLHQYSVVSTAQGLYHYDARLKKIMQYTGGENPLSDVKGLSSFLAKEVNGAINATDKTLSELTIGPIGVLATADYRFNRVLFTFLNSIPASDIDAFYNPSTTNYTFNTGDYVIQDNVVYYIEAGFSVTGVNPEDPEGPPRTPDLDSYPGVRVSTLEERSFTVSYNEMLQAFESFYDYMPGAYLQYGRRLLSSSFFNRNSAYVHNKGPKATYYGQAASDSKLNTILATEGDTTKIYNNLEYKSELYDTLGNDIYNETLTSLRVFNEYQTTGVIPLTVGTNIKRRMRTWRFTIPRDTTNTLARIRNPWVHVEAIFTNNNDKRLVLHEIIYAFTPAPM